MRSVLVAVFVMTTTAAHARPMPHFDLGGLVTKSDSIVVAKRVKTEEPTEFSRIGTYRVEKVIKGKLDPGAELRLEEFLYATEGRTLDPTVVLFTNNGTLLPAGLRVLEGGKVFRFEQWNNPGGWTMVPQGSDPQDNWQVGVTPLDLATFERQIAAAVARVDMMKKALALADKDKRRAAVLALLVPPGGPRVYGGFYEDVLAREAEQTLAQAGDVEGALLVLERDRTRFPPWNLAPLADLLSIATDGTKAANVRVAALTALGDAFEMLGNVDATHQVLALVDDPSPRIRAAAVKAIAPRGAMSSDQKENVRIKKLAREQRAAIDKRFATETDPRVLLALLAAGAKGRKGGPDVVAELSLERGTIVVVHCMRPNVKPSSGRLIVTQAGKPATLPSRIELACNGGSEGLGSSSNAPLVAGRYDVTVEVTIGKKPFTQSVGTLVINAAGEQTIEQP